MLPLKLAGAPRLTVVAAWLTACRRQAGPGGIARLPPAVARSQEKFWQCARCARVFWRGTRVRNNIARLQQWLVG
ncbi:MAG: hypothetical protein HZA91_20240 [Verrucomicrobia bacterium]|nr:hypothetical protein [Verrucomicrobiota bacterium]